MLLKTPKNLIFKHWFLISFIFLILLAFFLRFYNYQNRWGLAYDQAHDALVARYALEAKKVPLVGPFSSAGAFQTGGEWYWIIMLGTAFSPGHVLSPWIFVSILYLLFVAFIIFVGSELQDRKFGLLVGLLATVSTAQIAQSTNLTNQSPLALISLLAIWTMIRFIKTKKTWYLFFLGLTISLAPTVHLQGVLLLLFLATTIILSGLLSIRGFCLLIVGIFIPLVPLILFDLKNDFVNARNMFFYYFFDQFRISYEVLGRRWLTYAGIFWPTSWGHIIGGSTVTGYFLGILAFLLLIYDAVLKKLKKEWIIITTSFIAMVIMMRYTRAPLFDSYLVVLHPFVLILSGWIIYKLVKKQLILGLLFLSIIIIGSLIKDFYEISNRENFTAFETRSRIETLLKQYQREKYAIYSYRYKWADKNLALSLFLDAKDLSNDQGRRIGIVFATKSGEFTTPIISGSKTGYQMLDLQGSTSAELAEAQWVLVNKKQVYEATQEWYTINKPK